MRTVPRRPFRTASSVLALSLVLVGVAALDLFLAVGRPARSQNGVELLPCTDPRGCPDLIVNQKHLRQGRIEWRTFDPAHCAVQEGSTQAGTRRLLRFTFSSPNLGPGDLIIGAPADHPELFEFDTCHGHAHFKEYADYRLWTPAGYAAWRELRDATPSSVLSGDLLDANPAVKAQMVVGEKRGFCVVDIAPYSGPGIRRDRQKYTNCLLNQGISVGWQDIYGFTLDGQWVDITDVAAGDYVLEAEVNAEHVFREAGYANNAASHPVTISNR